MSNQRSKSSRQDIRVLKRNMIYCSGLPSSLTQNDLKSEAYFGQYGKIEKIVISPFPNRNYCSIYITFRHQFSAAISVLSCNEFQIDRSVLWCLFGTMKYCTFFMKRIDCKNQPNCPYLHAFEKKNQIEIKNSPSEAFPLHASLAKDVIKKYPELRQNIKCKEKGIYNLPSPEKIFSFIDEEKLKNQKKNQQLSERKHFAEKQLPKSNFKKKKELNFDDIVMKMLCYQFRKSQGSRLFRQIKKEEKKIKERIILQLRK